MKNFRNQIKNTLNKTYLILGSFLFKSKTNSIPPSPYASHVKGTGIFGIPEFDTYRYASAWKGAEIEWNLGNYRKSVRLRSEILTEIYAVQKIESDQYYPPILSKEFGEAFGHVGIMAAHLEASKVGIIPKGRRLIPVSQDKRARGITKSILLEYEGMPMEFCGEVFDSPPLWHVSERLQMIRSSNGFIDLYQMLEKLYSQRIVNKSQPILSLDSNYEERARAKLKEKGLPLGAWFVSLHVRNGDFFNSRRNQPLDTFVPAIKFILSNGGYVIRVGDSSMENLPELHGLIDVRSSSVDYWLHSYVLANGLFHIGTTSGPDWIPSLFGVPTLITNTTSIGRNMHSLSENSRFIPKHIVSNGKKWSLQQILEHREAYSEIEIVDENHPYKLESNSEIEILNATKEMLFDVNYPNKSKLDPYIEIIKGIRNATSAVGQGKISPVFIHMNESTFLKSS